MQGAGSGLQGAGAAVLGVRGAMQGAGSGLQGAGAAVLGVRAMQGAGGELQGAGAAVLGAGGLQGAGGAVLGARGAMHGAGSGLQRGGAAVLGARGRCTVRGWGAAQGAGGRWLGARGAMHGAGDAGAAVLGVRGAMQVPGSGLQPRSRPDRRADSSTSARDGWSGRAQPRPGRNNTGEIDGDRGLVGGDDDDELGEGWARGGHLGEGLATTTSWARPADAGTGPRTRPPSTRPIVRLVGRITFSQHAPRSELTCIVESPRPKMRVRSGR